MNSTLETLAESIPTALFETYGMTETCSHIALRQFNGANKSDVFSVLNGVTIRQDERGMFGHNCSSPAQRGIITNDIVEITDKNTFVGSGVLMPNHQPRRREKSIPNRSKSWKVVSLRLFYCFNPIIFWAKSYFSNRISGIFCKSANWTNSFYRKPTFEIWNSKSNLFLYRNLFILLQIRYYGKKHYKKLNQ